LRLNLSRAFSGLNAVTFIVPEVSLFAGAAGNANSWANRVRIFASAVASFALEVFFVVAAHLSEHWSSFNGSWYAAFQRLNAQALIVFQKARFAEATNDAVASADWTRVRVGAGGGAGGTTGEELFVFFALRNFRWDDEELVIDLSFALASRHANTLTISQ